MTQTARLIALAEGIGADIKTLIDQDGDLTSLSTTAKTNLVAAINEIYTIANSNAVINDSAGNGATTVTWSADKIYDSIEVAKSAVTTSILGGASAAYDTLIELQNLLVTDDGLITALTTAVGKRVRYDAIQTLTTGEKLQACQNIGIGDPETDLVAAYTAAKV